MRRTATMSPGREARQTRFMWCRMSATRYRLIGPRTSEARREIGLAESCSYRLSRSIQVATFCFLPCGASSSLPSQSRRQTISKAFAVLNHYVILQALVGQVDNQKRFREYSYPLVYFAALWTRGYAFWNSREQELDVKRGHCQNCSVSQDLGTHSSPQ